MLQVFSLQKPPIPAPWTAEQGSSCPSARDGVGCSLEERIYAAAVTLTADQASRVASWWVFNLLTELLKVLFPFRIVWQPCYFVLCVYHSL